MIKDFFIFFLDAHTIDNRLWSPKACLAAGFGRRAFLWFFNNLAGFWFLEHGIPEQVQHKGNSSSHRSTGLAL
jgi:hypothetical protein